MARRRAKAGGKLRADQMTSWSIIHALAVLAVPIIGTRVTGRESIAVLTMPVAAFLCQSLLADTMWERSVFRGVRLLLRADKTGEARKLRRATALIGAMTGLILFCVLFFLHPVLFGEFRAETGSRVLMTAAIPGLMLLGAMGAMRGYLRACGASGELRFASVLQVVLMVILPAVLGKVLQMYGSKVDALLQTERYEAVYGALGILAGVGISCFLTFLFLLVMELRFRASGLFTTRKHGGYAYFTPEGVLPLLLFALFMIMLWKSFRMVFGESETAVSHFSDWGGYFGGVLCPVLFTGTAILLPFILSVYQMHARYQRNDMVSALDRYATMVRRSMIVSLPTTVFLCAEALPMTGILFGKTEEQMAAVFRIQVLILPGMFFLLLLTIMFLRFGTLRAAMPGIIAGSILFVVLLLVLGNGNRGFYAFVIASLAGVYLAAIVTAFLMAVSLSYRQEWTHGLLIPLIASVIASLPAFLLATFLSNIMGEVLTIVLSAVISLVLYILLLSVMHGVTEYELYRLPGGHLLAGFSRVSRR